MLIKLLKKRKANKVAEQLRQDAETRQIMLDNLHKSVNRNMLHADISTEGIRVRKKVVPGTVSYAYYQTVERLGASEDFLAKLKPDVRDWPEENPGDFSFHS